MQMTFCVKAIPLNVSVNVKFLSGVTRPHPYLHDGWRVGDGRWQLVEMSSMVDWRFGLHPVRLYTPPISESFTTAPILGQNRKSAPRPELSTVRARSGGIYPA